MFANYFTASVILALRPTAVNVTVIGGLAPTMNQQTVLSRLSPTARSPEKPPRPPQVVGNPMVFDESVAVRAELFRDMTLDDWFSTRTETANCELSRSDLTTVTLTPPRSAVSPSLTLTGAPVSVVVEPLSSLVS